MRHVRVHKLAVSLVDMIQRRKDKTIIVGEFVGRQKGVLIHTVFPFDNVSDLTLKIDDDEALSDDDINDYKAVVIDAIHQALTMISEAEKDAPLINFDVQANKVSDIIADVIYELPDDDVYVDEDAMTYFVLSKEYALIQSDEYLEKIIVVLYLLYKFKAWELEKDPYHEQLFENMFLIEKIFELKGYMPRYRGIYDEDFRRGYANYVAGRGSQLVSMAM